jgi:ketosteroid isomerase-like protein
MLMTSPNHDITRAFFAALSAGNLPDELLTEDMTAWTTSSGVNWNKARYQGGVKMLASVFNGPYAYTIDSLTAEEDRVAAEVRAQGTLINGETFSNRYVFMLHIRDGRIASVAEHFNPIPVRETLGPLIQTMMAKAQA